jgi:hypothetical protein
VQFESAASTGTDLAFLVAECGRRARQVKDLKI